MADFFDELETLNMAALLEFARMLENEPTQTQAIIVAAHLVHMRIASLMPPPKRQVFMWQSAVSLAQPQKRLKKDGLFQVLFAAA